MSVTFKIVEQGNDDCEECLCKKCVACCKNCRETDCNSCVGIDSCVEGCALEPYEECFSGLCVATCSNYLDKHNF